MGMFAGLLAKPRNSYQTSLSDLFARAFAGLHCGMATIDASLYDNQNVINFTLMVRVGRDWLPFEVKRAYDLDDMRREVQRVREEVLLILDFMDDRTPVWC